MRITSKKRSAKARKIVDAALVQFERHGFQATSLEQIAAEADMGKSTLYDYFKSKEELFTAAIEAASDQWISAIERIIAENDDPLERLEHFTETILGFADDNHACRHVNDQRLFIEIFMQTVMAGGVFYQRRNIIREPNNVWAHCALFSFRKEPAPAWYKKP